MHLQNGQAYKTAAKFETELHRWYETIRSDLKAGINNTQAEGEGEVESQMVDESTLPVFDDHSGKPLETKTSAAADAVQVAHGTGSLPAETRAMNASTSSSTSNNSMHNKSHNAVTLSSSHFSHSAATVDAHVERKAVPGAFNAVSVQSLANISCPSSSNPDPMLKSLSVPPRLDFLQFGLPHPGPFTGNAMFISLPLASPAMAYDDPCLRLSNEGETSNSSNNNSNGLSVNLPFPKPKFPFDMAHIVTRPKLAGTADSPVTLADVYTDPDPAAHSNSGQGSLSLQGHVFSYQAPTVGSLHTIQLPAHDAHTASQQGLPYTASSSFN